MAVLFRDFYFIDADRDGASRGDLLVEGGRISRIGTDLSEAPRGVEIVDIITILRNKAVSKGIMSDEHKKVGQYLLANGATIPLNPKYEEIRERLGLPRRPVNTLGDKKALAILRRATHAN